MKKFLLLLYRLGIAAMIFGVGMRIGQRFIKSELNPKYPVVQVDPKSLDMVKHFIVLISNEGLLGVSRGTGIIIDSTHVLTCNHLVPQVDQEMWIYTYPVGRVLKGRVQYSEMFTDLALIKLDHPVNLPFYPRFNDTVNEGQGVIVIGNILGSMRWFVTYGTVGGVDGPYVLTDALIRGGNSGGPWFNYHGEIVALTDWGLTHNEHEVGISGGISSKTIHSFLNHSKHPNILQMLFGGLN
jgi:S1-C subfamily serine protease